MVLLADLDFVLCTETIESVSISKSIQIKKAEAPKSKSKDDMLRYKSRHKDLETLSLHHHFLLDRNGLLDKNGQKIINPKKRNHKQIIPNFVGVNGTPCFPISESCARHTLIAYKPWRAYPNQKEWKHDFDDFIHSKYCPQSAKLAYGRVVLRHFNGTKHNEPVNSKADHSKNHIAREDEDLIDLMGLHQSDDTDADRALLHRLDRGINFKWDADPKVSEQCNSTHQAHAPPHLTNLIPPPTAKKHGRQINRRTGGMASEQSKRGSDCVVWCQDDTIA